jgi:hypothetical protein
MFYVGYTYAKNNLRRLTDNQVQTWAEWAPGEPSTEGDVVVHIMNNIVKWFTVLPNAPLLIYRALCMGKYFLKFTSMREIKKTLKII